jgi:hypothetical protein
LPYARGWESGEEQLPPGYGLDTPDGGTWALRRPDGTAVSYFGAVYRAGLLLAYLAALLEPSAVLFLPHQPPPDISTPTIGAARLAA